MGILKGDRSRKLYSSDARQGNAVHFNPRLSLNSPKGSERSKDLLRALSTGQYHDDKNYTEADIMKDCIAQIDDCVRILFFSS